MLANVERNALHVWTECGDRFLRAPFPLLTDSGVICYQRHVSGRLAVVRKNTEPEYIIEVWNLEKLLQRYPTKHAHGAIYPQQATTFGGLCWSPDGCSLLYTAEVTPVKTCSWWDATADDTGPAPGQKVNRLRRGKRGEEKGMD